MTVERSRIERVEAVCAAHFKISLDRIKSRSREDEVFICRVALWRSLIDYLLMSQSDVGRHYGFNHGTVCMGIKSLQNRMDTDKKLGHRIADFNALVKDSLASSLSRKPDWFKSVLRRGEDCRLSSRQTAIPGTTAAELLFETWPMPVCTLWLRWMDKEHTTLELLNCYVPERLRRLGLLTRTFQMVVACGKNLRTVTTQSATAYSEPWLIKTGWRKGREGWVYEVRPNDPGEPSGVKPQKLGTEI